MDVYCVTDSRNRETIDRVWCNGQRSDRGPWDIDIGGEDAYLACLVGKVFRGPYRHAVESNWDISNLSLSAIFTGPYSLVRFEAYHGAMTRTMYARCAQMFVWLVLQGSCLLVILQLPSRPLEANTPKSEFIYLFAQVGVAPGKRQFTSDLVGLVLLCNTALAP